MQNSHDHRLAGDLASRPSVPVAPELPVVSFWAVRSWMAAWDGGAGGIWHILPTPPQGVGQAHP